MAVSPPILTTAGAGAAFGSGCAEDDFLDLARPFFGHDFGLAAGRQPLGIRRWLDYFLRLDRLRQRPGRVQMGWAAKPWGLPGPPESRAEPTPPATPAIVASSSPPNSARAATNARRSEFTARSAGSALTVRHRRRRGTAGLDSLGGRRGRRRFHLGRSRRCSVWVSGRRRRGSAARRPASASATA